MKTSRDIQKLINAIDSGVQVYSGMIHHNRVRMYLKEALNIADTIEEELNTANNRVDGMQSALDCSRQHYDMQTKAFDQLRSENAKLTERNDNLQDLYEKLYCDTTIKYDELNRENKRLTERNKELIANNAILRQRIDSSEASRNYYKDKTEKLTERVKELEEKLSEKTRFDLHREKCYETIYWDRFKLKKELADLKESKTIYVRRK